MKNYSLNIALSGLTIYDHISSTNENLFIPNQCLQKILEKAMIGLSLSGYPLRTRSKFVKSSICKALGYPVPETFKKTQPRFVGQNFDVYTQKSLNVQIWNEEVDALRRYVFFRVNESDVITAVKVINGAELANFDRTGTLTRKYQATMNSFGHNVCSKEDSKIVKKWIVIDSSISLKNIKPNQLPQKNNLLGINEIYRRLLPMLGKTIGYIDAVQERNRGAELHAMICKYLGYSSFEDDGTYPDILNQLLEIKLQTSPTIDLGLHSPEGNDCILAVEDTKFCSQDIRYAIFDGLPMGDRVLLRNLYLVSGEDFSYYFPLFKGKITNAKLQLPLPNNFFD